MLAERLDQQRVTINLKLFQEIEFSYHGIPNLILELMCFVSRLDREKVIEMKIR